MSGGNHDNAAIGEALKQWRVQKGLSQTSVAKQMQHAGLRWYQTTVARVEKGERPLLIREAEPLARILGHEASDLSAVLAGTDAPWTGRDILDRLRGATFDSVTAEDLADAVAEIERLRRVAKLTDIVADDTAKDLDALETRAEQAEASVSSDLQYLAMAIETDIPSDRQPVWNREWLSGMRAGMNRAAAIVRSGGVRR